MVFPFEFWENFTNTLFTEHLWTAFASTKVLKKVDNHYYTTVLMSIKVNTYNLKMYMDPIFISIQYSSVVLHKTIKSSFSFNTTDEDWKWVILKL